MKREKWIDVAKGIAMISVILGHMGDKNINNVVFAYHLGVFFIISGYLIKDTIISKSELNKKFERLMKPYFLTCLIIMVLDCINVIIFNHDKTVYGITNVIANDFFRTFFASGSIRTFGSINIGARIGAIWFLPALYFGTFITYKIYNSANNWIKRFAYSVFLAVLAYILSKYIWLPFSILSSAVAVPFIIFGKYLKEKNILEKIRLRDVLLLGILFIIGIVLKKSVVSFVTSYFDDIILTSIITISSSVFVIKISQLFKNDVVFSWVGKNSLNAMCIHLVSLETMSKWYNKIWNLLGLENSLFIRIITELLFVIIILLIIELGKKILNIYQNKKNIMQKEYKANQSHRDLTLDLIRFISITLMILTHTLVEPKFRTIVFSFHMITFVIISGYFYKKPESLCRGLIKTLKKMIIPYSIFAILYFINNSDISFYENLIKVITGISFTKNFLINIDSIGPIYYLLMLSLVKIVYMIIDKFSKEKFMPIVIIIMSCIGLYMGKFGYWLPWSLDVSLYCLIFYYIGHIMKKYDILKYLVDRKYYYFIFSCFWIYMIYLGGMEIAVRKYEPYGMVIIGTISAFLTIFIIIKLLVNEQHILSRIAAYIGQSTIYILIIHTLYNKKIISAINDFCGLDPRNIFNILVSMFVQLLLGSLIYLIYNFLMMQIKRFKKLERHEILQNNT